jgi:hypothetical protein
MRLGSGLGVALLGGAICLGGTPTSGAPGNPSVSIALPADTWRYAPGPGVEFVVKDCSVCHSASYVLTQPRLTRKQWAAEVAKMRNAYGAPVPESDVATIVDYLVAQHGKE